MRLIVSGLLTSNSKLQTSNFNATSLMKRNNLRHNPKYNRRAIFSWCMFDFANSPFTTLVITFIYSTYFTKAIAENEIIGTALWSKGVTVSSLIVALLSPIMGAIADRGGHRKLFLLLTTALTIVASGVLYKFLPGQTMEVLMWFIIANIGFEMGMVFYNAFLPDIAPPGKIGRISGYGWSLGYLGGLLAMVVVLFGLVWPEKPVLGFSQTSEFTQGELPSWSDMSLDEIRERTAFPVANTGDTLIEVRGLALNDRGEISGIVVLGQYSTQKDTLSLNEVEYLSELTGVDLSMFAHSVDNNIRASNLLVALWFLIFSIPIFLWVKEDKSRISKIQKDVIASSLRQLRETFHEIRRYRQIIRLLVARLFYNDGLITIFAFGGIYAAGTFNFSFSEIMIFGIVLNVAAGAGAFAMGFLDDRLGGRKTIQISLYGLIIATVIAVLSPNKIFFWIAGIIVGIFSGPNQAASRSLMGRFVPPNKENEFFGFFAFSGKATAFLGPFLLGSLTEVFNSQRVGVSAVLLFFIVGSLFLILVDEKEGKKSAGRD